MTGASSAPTGASSTEAAAPVRSHHRGRLFGMPSKRDVERLADEVHDLFEEVWRIPRFGGHRRGFRPQVDCFHTDDPHELTVVVELAGVEPDTVRVDATERHLRVWGERVRPRVEGQVFQQMEIEYGQFERQISL